MSEAPWTDEERAAAVAYLEKWEAAEQVKQGRANLRLEHWRRIRWGPRRRLHPRRGVLPRRSGARSLARWRS